jgi:methionine-rich copper-binding protein CopC
MRNIFVAVVLSSQLLGVVAASAHAMLDRADPRVGNTVSTAPRQVTLWFTQNLEGAFSTIEVRDSGGARVDAGKASVDGADHHILRVPVKALAPGAYKVIWRVLSVDTHITEGNFSFSVGK